MAQTNSHCTPKTNAAYCRKFTRYFIYGNYIDEVLLMRNLEGTAADYYYGHDHLYNPAVLFDSSGSVVERYEYDAYGAARIYNTDFTTLKTTSDYNNPYYFTGRRLDTLDGGDLKIMYYRARYYDPYTGRFLQRDPLGIDPAETETNVFDIEDHYVDGMNLYQYVGSRPIIGLDPYGLMWPPGYEYEPPFTPKPTLPTCPEGYKLRHKPGYKPDRNGCGPLDAKPWELGYYVPDGVRIGKTKVSFKNACDAHDRCYGTCNKTKSGCEKNFLKALKNACSQKFAKPFKPDWMNNKLQTCYGYARIYYNAVKWFGDDAYIRGQNDSCECVPICSLTFSVNKNF